MPFIRTLCHISLILFLQMSCIKRDEKKDLPKESPPPKEMDLRGVRSKELAAIQGKHKAKYIQDLTKTKSPNIHIDRSSSTAFEQLMLAGLLKKCIPLLKDSTLQTLLKKSSEQLTLNFLQNWPHGSSFYHSALLLGQITDYKNKHLLFGHFATPRVAFSQLTTLAKEKIGLNIEEAELFDHLYHVEFINNEQLVNLDMLGSTIYTYSLFARKWLNEEKRKKEAFQVISNITNKLLLLLGYYQDSENQPIGGFGYTLPDWKPLRVDPEAFLANPRLIIFPHQLQSVGDNKFKTTIKKAYLRDYLTLILGAMEFYKLTHPKNTYDINIFSRPQKDDGIFPTDVHQLAIGVLAILLVNLNDLFLDSEKRIIYDTNERKASTNLITLSLFADILSQSQALFNEYQLSNQIFPEEVLSEVDAIKEQIELLTFFVTTQISGKFLSNDKQQYEVNTSFELAYASYALFALHQAVNSPFLYKKAFTTYKRIIKEFWNPEISILYSHLEHGKSRINYSPFEAALIVQLLCWINGHTEPSLNEKVRNKMIIFNLLYGTGMLDQEQPTKSQRIQIQISE